MEHLYIGSTPADEPCAQVGTADYSSKARAECKRFIAQIQRHYPEPDNGYLRIKSNPHDFGTYFEVVAVFDENDAQACAWAFAVEGDEKGVLQAWDDHHIA
jgi:hypothetical protein